MPPLTWILGSTFLISVISFVGAAALFFRTERLKQVLYILVAFSAGGMMGGAFFHLLPEALLMISPQLVSAWFLTGFCVFFLLERLILWRHCHDGVCPVHPFTYLNLIGDGVHNFIDGVLISASYLAGIEVGIATTLAIMFHEIPQELGDFGILIYGGLKFRRALILNFLSALLAVFGAVCGYFVASDIKDFIPFALPFAAGGFMYIAGVDLLPELNKEPKLSKAMTAFFVFVFGLGLMAFLKFIMGG